MKKGMHMSSGAPCYGSGLFSVWPLIIPFIFQFFFTNLTSNTFQFYIILNFPPNFYALKLKKSSKNPHLLKQ